MRRTRIKICGVCDHPTAATAAEAGADAIGLVFVPTSPRRITASQGLAIVTALPAFVEPVGLFVDCPIDQIRRTAAEVGLSTVQLHGQESPEQVKQLAPLRVIKAVPFDPSGFTTQLKPWRAMRQHLTALLIDSPTADAARPDGGSGRGFDWRALADLQQSGALADLPPLVLAGGLTADNVTEAISLVRPYAVDVSSGVESSRGVKNRSLISAFCQSVERADRDH